MIGGLITQGGRSHFLRQFSLRYSDDEVAWSDYKDAYSIVKVSSFTLESFCYLGNEIEKDNASSESDVTSSTFACSSMTIGRL